MSCEDGMGNNPGHPLPSSIKVTSALVLFPWLTTNTVLCCHQPPPCASCWDGACSFIHLVAHLVSVSCVCGVCQASWVLQLQLIALCFSYNAGDSRTSTERPGWETSTRLCLSCSKCFVSLLATFCPLGHEQVHCCVLAYHFCQVQGWALLQSETSALAQTTPCWIVCCLPFHLTQPWMSPWAGILLSARRALLQTHSCAMKELIPLLLVISIGWLFFLIYSGVHCKYTKSYWLLSSLLNVVQGPTQVKHQDFVNL